MIGVNALLGARIVDVVLAALAAARAGRVAVDDVGLTACELAEAVRPDRAIVAAVVLARLEEVEFVVVVAWDAVLRVAVDALRRWPFALLLGTMFIEIQWFIQGGESL